MCLGIPGKVIRTFVEHDVLMGKVDFGGVSKQVCLEHVADVRVGEYVLVHVGFALSKIDEQEAGRVFAFLEGMNQLEELSIASGPLSVAGGPLPGAGERGGVAP
jgi:hydrogenase expression/formation protein HypC